MSQHTLRIARVEDATQISTMTRAMVAEIGNYGNHPVSTDDSNWKKLTEVIKTTIEEADQRYVVIEQLNGNLAGFASTEIRDLHKTYAPKKILHVSAVYVLPEFRNTGIGTSLLKDLLNWGRELNCVESELYVVNGNPAAVLYQRLGFTEIKQKFMCPLTQQSVASQLISPFQFDLENAQLEIRSLIETDPEVISAAFTEIGWNKPVVQYEEYFEQQRQGAREVLVATFSDKFAGYITINWHPSYSHFREAGIPEIQDLNVLPHFRGRGVGTSLMNRAEELALQCSQTVGIGVGMYAGYGNAQRMYILRGYVPDGRGLTYKGNVLRPMEATIVDDDLVLYFTKTFT